jgi:hypothetical protein
MAYEQKDLQGVLFKNDKREKDTHPHATGRCLIDGVEYWISAWTKEGANGKFQSLAFKRKDEKPSEKPAAPDPFEDDSMPF